MKTYDYLEGLPLTTAQKEVITESGYENEPTLYIICKTIPVAMRQVLDVDSLDELEKALWERMDALERALVEKDLSALQTGDRESRAS